MQPSLSINQKRINSIDLLRGLWWLRCFHCAKDTIDISRHIKKNGG